MNNLHNNLYLHIHTLITYHMHTVTKSLSQSLLAISESHSIHRIRRKTLEKISTNF